MSSSLLPHLRTLLDDATAALPAVSVRKMFGCDCFFAGDTIFAMVWKDGRIGVKLLSDEDHAAAMALEGAEPWSPGGKMKPRAWVLLPEACHDDEAELHRWVGLAHEQALRAPAKKKAAKKAATKKAATKKAPPVKKASTKAPSAAKKKPASK